MPVKSPRAKHSRPRPRLPRQQRERQILDVAARAFSSRGYDAVSMDGLATEAGISKPLLYAYFGSKEGLYQRTLERSARQFHDRVVEAVGEAPSAELGLWAGIVAFFDFVEENRRTWLPLMPRGDSTAPPLGGGAVQERERVLDLVSELLRAKGAEGGLSNQALDLGAPLAGAFVAVCESVAAWWLAHPDEPKELQALRVMNFVWYGLGRLQGGDIWMPPGEWWSGEETG